jgi:hypothetical protein
MFSQEVGGMEGKKHVIAAPMGLQGSYNILVGFGKLGHFSPPVIGEDLRILGYGKINVFGILTIPNS